MRRTHNKCQGGCRSSKHYVCFRSIGNPKRNRICTKAPYNLIFRRFRAEIDTGQGYRLAGNGLSVVIGLNTGVPAAFTLKEDIKP